MYRKWLILKIKQNIGSYIFWLVAAISVLLMITAGYAGSRMEENRTVLIVAEPSAVPEMILEQMMADVPEGYSFEVAKNEEQLRVAILRGEAYCGIVLTEKLEQITGGTIPGKGVILYSSASAGAVDVLQEVVFPYVLKAASGPKLKQYYLDAGLTEDSDALRAIIGENDRLLNEYRLHLCDVVSPDEEEGNSSTEATGFAVKPSGNLNSFTVKLLTFVILMLFVFILSVWEENRENAGFLQCKSKQERMALIVESGLIRCAMVGILTFIITCFV